MTNPTFVSNELIDNRQSSDSKWDFAIDEAKLEIKALQIRLNRLQTALSTFEQNKKDRTIWPGMNKIGQSSDDLS
jgi:hypothetical protein